jgi:hypothetical protein
VRQDAELISVTAAKDFCSQHIGSFEVAERRCERSRGFPTHGFFHEMTPRRVATPELKRRDATQTIRWPDFRGLKPTATFGRSLRERAH